MQLRYAQMALGEDVGIIIRDMKPAAINNK